MTTAAPASKPKARRERLMLRVGQGCFLPADNFTAGRLRARGYKKGDIVAAEIVKPRNPGFHRLAHQIGALCAENIDDFHGMPAHSVLKRLQIEARVGCEEVGIKVPGYGYMIQFIPRSLGYESMSQEEFFEVTSAFCRYVAANYWPGLTAEQIEQMAACYVGEV